MTRRGINPGREISPRTISLGIAILEARPKFDLWTWFAQRVRESASEEETKYIFCNASSI
jgi:hypothetical protein